MLASTFFSILWYETMCMLEVPIEDLWCYKLCTDSGQWSGVDWREIESNRIEMLCSNHETSRMKCPLLGRLLVLDVSGNVMRLELGWPNHVNHAGGVLHPSHFTSLQSSAIIWRERERGRQRLRSYVLEIWWHSMIIYSALCCWSYWVSTWLGQA